MPPDVTAIVRRFDNALNRCILQVHTDDGRRQGPLNQIQLGLYPFSEKVGSGTPCATHGDQYQSTNMQDAIPV
jgi:hypothetical protein